MPVILLGQARRAMQTVVFMPVQVPIPAEAGDIGGVGWERGLVHSDVVWRGDGDAAGLCEYVSHHTEILIAAGKWEEPERYDG